MSDSDIDWRSAYRFLEEQLGSMVLQVAQGYERLEQRLADVTRPSVRHVRLAPLPDGRLRSVVVADGADLRYCFHVYRDEVLVRTEPYGEPNTLVWQPAASGRYRVQATVRRNGDDTTRASRSSASIDVEASSS